MMQRSKRALLISVLLHVLILLALVWAMQSHVLRGTSHSIVNAYFVQNEAKPKASASQPIKAISVPHPVIPAPAGIQPSAAGALDPRLGEDDKLVANDQPVIVQTISRPNTSEIQQLLQIIANNIQQNLHYPHLAQTHWQQGASILQFDLAPNGNLNNIQLIQSSGIDVLDEAAKQAIIASSPITIPSAIKVNQTLTLRLPVHFNLNA